jgi:hypothetical protein
MSRDFTLADSSSLADLQVFLGRAGRVEDGSVRLIADGSVLAVYVAVFYPSGLLDQSPTVLGLRTFALVEPVEFDAVVPARSLTDRLARAVDDQTDASLPVRVSVPMEVYTVTWAAISPPRGGWKALDSTWAAPLVAVARAGIAEVAAAVPADSGEAIVQRVRAEVWGRPIEGLEHVPAGAAFAGLSLGFVLDDEEEVRVLETGPWTRLSTTRGHVLVKRRAWSLLG